jgi:hypothetical protein
MEILLAVLEFTADGLSDVRNMVKMMRQFSQVFVLNASMLVQAYAEQLRITLPNINPKIYIIRLCNILHNNTCFEKEN